MRLSLSRRVLRTRGFALAEVMIGAVLIGFVGVGAVQSMGVLNRNAARNRVMTNAQAIVQRNIDTALSITASKSAIPAILATTSTSGVVHDDDGGGDNLVNVVVQGTSSVQLVKGTLTRTVTAVTNADGADIREVTFSLACTYRGKALPAYALTTMRSIDD